MPDSLSSRSCALPRWLLATVLGVAALAFLPTLTGGFLADDFVYIARFRDLPWSEWPALFTHEWSGGVWGSPLRELRPFAALSFMTDARMFGGDPMGYRLTNLALQLLATFFITQLAWFYSDRRAGPALIAGLIFALHPAHAEAVAWITGRVDLLATTAALLYWLSAEFFARSGRRANAIAATLVLFIGIFSKELCMFAPLLLLLRWVITDLRAPRAQWLRRAVLLAASIVVVVIYAAARRAAFGQDHIGYNVWTDEPAWHRQVSYAGWFVGLRPFFATSEAQAFPSLATIHGLWIALGVATIAGLMVALWRKAHIAALVLFFGGVWYFLTVAPLTGVVYHAPRHLYFPTMGLALALGLACAGKTWRTVLGVGLVGWFAAGHVAAVRPWMRAASTSRDALAQLDAQLATAGPGALAITSVPPTLGPVWMWAWSSPQCVGPTFLAHPPAKILEHPVSYSRSDPWLETRKPLETLRAAPAVVVLYVDESARVVCRPLTREEIPARAAALDERIKRGLSPGSWEEWVKSIAAP